MKIVFLLPCEGSCPGGGHKVIYEYANRLTERGHSVHVIHFAAAEPRKVARTLRGKLRPLRYFSLKFHGGWGPESWFQLNPKVKSELVMTPATMLLPKADAYIASWWSTAERLALLRNLPGRRFYLIQHLETWAAAEEDVMATWKAPLEKIVIARWLQKIAADLGETAHYIPNGLDFVKFGCDVAPESRESRRVAMLYSDGVSWKGSAEGIKALCLLKEKYPDLEAEVFGVHPRSNAIPEWIQYWQRPAQDELRRIYNRAAIFLAPSHSEGWGLPPCEAMACGVAVVATDIGGHREFCMDGQNALLVPVKDPEAMAKAASRLIDDPTFRIQMAKNGRQHIQRFTWNAAVDSLEELLTSSPAKANAA